MAYFINMHTKGIGLILLITLFIPGILQSISAQDSLLLYTQASCSNCKAVKRILINNKINFIEKDLADQQNAAEMLYKLKQIHYTKDINLPVVLLNNRMYHPAYQTTTGLITLDIANVMDTLINRNKRGEMHLTNLQMAQQATSTAQTIHSISECNISTPTVLVIAEFKAEADAKSTMQKLIDKGFTYAGMVYSSGMYRVYSKLFLKQEIAEQELINTRKQNPGCYLLAITK